ncbi:hypothetical protein HDU98_010615, partial [Podochytrium sp. JEL0797]
MLFNQLTILALVATNMQALPTRSSEKRVGSACATFGDWSCDSTGTLLMECAYGETSESLSWSSAGPCYDASHEKKYSATAGSSSSASAATASTTTSKTGTTTASSTSAIPSSTVATTSSRAPRPVTSNTDSASSGTTSTANVLINGSGSGTYYYDAAGNSCPGQGSLAAEGNGYT